MMTNNNRLNADEVMCLQMAGMPIAQIIKTDLNAFDALYDVHSEFEDYLDKANSVLDRQEALGIVTLTVQDDEFPQKLKAIGSDCPPVIHCLGNMTLLKKEKTVAIIGARACDRPGYNKAYDLAVQYAREGNVIVSGLAIGCDTAAHRGSLAVNGETIAVVATGLNIIHPHESEALQAEILRGGGLILSEQPFGMKANPTRLVARNRLQAALSEAVILAQCPAQSGSLHTMRFARNYNKESYAAVFPNRTDANAGNFNLIESRQAKPL